MDSCKEVTRVYQTRQADPSDLPEVLALLRDAFDREETMINSLRRKYGPIDDLYEEAISDDLARLITAITAIMPAIVAIDPDTKSIVGVIAMIVSRNPKFAEAKSDGVCAVFAANEPRTPLVKEYFRYLTEIGESADLFARYPEVRSTLEFYAIAVRKEHRRRGLSGILTEAGISLARTTPEIGLVFGVYTSLYSKRSAERHGLRSCMDVDLLGYKDSDGSPIFYDTPPHNVVSVMVLTV